MSSSSNWKRWALCGLCLLVASSESGLMYGWPALRRELINETTDPLSERSLGVIFIIGTWCTLGLRLPFGIIRDRYGTRLATCTPILCGAIGIFGLGVSPPNNAVALACSAAFVGIGAGVFLTVQPVAELFGKNSGAILSTFSAASQVSALMFTALTNLPVSRFVAFGGFSAALILLACISAFVLPLGGSFSMEEASINGGDSMKKEVIPFEDRINEYKLKEEEEKEEENGIGLFPKGNNDPNSTNESSERPTTLNQQMTSLEYLAACIWFSTCVVPLEYYIATIGFQLERRGDTDGFYTTLFSVLFAAVIVVIPFGGSFADRFGLGAGQALTTIMLASSIFMLASDHIGLNGQVLGMALFSGGSALVSGMFFTNIAKRFGYSHFGTLAGIGILISANAGILQYPLIAWAADGHEAKVNLGCGFVLLLLLPYCVWIQNQERAGSPKLPPLLSVNSSSNQETIALAASQASHYET